MDYYDKILLLIPIILTSGIGISSITNEIRLNTALFISSLFAAAIIYHAMFVRTPIQNNIREIPQQ